MLGRLILGAIGAAYGFLAFWSVTNVDTTTKAVGLSLQPGAGQSEFLVLYGGLQAAIGALLLIPAVCNRNVALALKACVLLHSFIVAARLLSLVLYAGMPTTTFVFAGLEIAILILSIVGAISARMKT